MRPKEKAKVFGLAFPWVWNGLEELLYQPLGSERQYASTGHSDAIPPHSFDPHLEGCLRDEDAKSNLKLSPFIVTHIYLHF